MSLKLNAISNPASHNEALDKEIEEISTNIRMNLGLEPAPTIWNALDVSLVTAIPPIALSLSGKEIKEWWNFKKASKRNALLTEVSRFVRS